MAQRNRLTNNSDETDIAQLISGDSIFSIPYFQRPYKWKPERLRQLNTDVLSLVDESSDFHFLGAVIVHGRRSNPSDPDIFDVIDGQQRITTLFLYLCATVKILANLGEYTEAAALLLKYLVINRDTGSLSNFKIHSCKEDRSQLNQVYLDLVHDAKLKESLGGFVLRPLPKSGADKGTLINNYRSALRFLKDEYDQGGKDRIRAIYTSLLNKMSVVQIDVWDPTNGPKIFDSLNSRQEPMTIGDLIRNEVFARVADQHPDIIERIDAEYWQPFYKHFEQSGRNLFDGYFFPYGLIKRPNLKKSEVYTSLRKDWDNTPDPQQIVHELTIYQNPYIDLQTGSNFTGHCKEVAAAFRQLYLTNLPSSTLPFLMQLSKAAADQKVPVSNVVEICATVESFLVRRAVSGYEPTGLHSVFKRLWQDCEGEYTAGRIALEIAKHKTVPWPQDDEFAQAVSSRPLFNVGVTDYLIMEFDRSLRGDASATSPWIEHVLPQNPEESWFEIFSKEEHARYKDLLANLLPLSSEMNRSLSNKSYEVKRVRYREDSVFKTTRQFAEKIDQWIPAELLSRAAELAQWAVERWPHQRPLVE